VSKKVDEVMADEDNSDEIPQEPSSARSRSSEKPEHHDRRVGSKPVLFARIAQFLRDVRAEMRRVSWPSPNVVKNTTLITLVAVIFFAVYLFAVDQLWAFLLTQLNHLLNSLTGA
jgi:preprotein translocase subunit SecE